MKKVLNIICLLFVLAILSITNVDAASASISASAYSCYTGDYVSIAVNYYGGAWNLYVTGAASDTIVGYDVDANNVSGSKSYSVPTGSAGTVTYTLSGTITDAETDVTETINQTITISVVDRPAPEPQPQPQPQQQQPQQQQTQPQQQQQQPQTPTEEPKEEVKEEPKEDPIVVESIDVVGFNLRFNEKQTEYELELDKGVTSLYITTKSNGESSVADGLVDITDKKDLIITFTKGLLTKDYKLIFTEKSNKVIDTTGDVKKDDNKKGFNIFIVTTAIFGLSTLVLFIMLLASKKKDKEPEAKPIIKPITNTQPAVQPATPTAVQQPTQQPTQTVQK